MGKYYYLTSYAGPGDSGIHWEIFYDSATSDFHLVGTCSDAAWNGSVRTDVEHAVAALNAQLDVDAGPEDVMRCCNCDNPVADDDDVQCTTCMEEESEAYRRVKRTSR